MIGERVLLDTSVVVRHFRKEGLLNDAFVAHDLYLPQVALGELYAGAEKSARPEHHHKLIKSFLPSVTILASNHETTRRYGRVWSDLARTGCMIPINDVWIAALALQHVLPLVTDDAHFENIPDLKVLIW
jgi:tRNA(fMet)-specific endonuclease VapC